jgi:NADPH2:quinone reductase
MDTPAVGAGEVCVALTFSGVNPSDVKSRKGRPDLAKPAFDMIAPHSDGAGVITEVGAGVPASRVGERVWVWNGQWQRPLGTASTHIVLDQTQAVAMPDEMSDEVGACMGIPGLTACHAVFGSGDVTGQTVLIQGGGGTVGYLAVQLAVWGGAKVIVTCSPSDMELCTSAGAHHVLDYKDPDLAAKILAANDGALVERIVEVEFGVNVEIDAAVIATNGTIAAYGSAQNLSPELPFFQLLFKAATIDVILIYLLPLSQRQAIITRLHAAFKDNALTCPIAAVFPLDQTIAAHELVESGVRNGAVLVDVTA